MSEWRVHEGGETAVTNPEPVVADGDVFASVSALWSDEDGVRVSINWSAELFAGISRVEDMSQGQAHALAAALVHAAGIAPPNGGV